jgi:hypothetical protein
MIRRLLSITTLLAIGIGGVVALPASAQEGAVCQLAGGATFSPGLSTTSQAFTFSFTGTLSNCQSTVSGLTGGSIAASGSGSGTCANSTATGTATVTWNDGTTSGVTFTTNGAGALVDVSETVTSGHFAGDSGTAQLAFQPASGQDCATVPVTSATFDGPSAIGAA